MMDDGRWTMDEIYEYTKEEKKKFSTSRYGEMSWDEFDE